MTFPTLRATTSAPALPLPLTASDGWQAYLREASARSKRFPAALCRPVGSVSELSSCARVGAAGSRRHSDMDLCRPAWICHRDQGCRLPAEEFSLGPPS